jgi:DNA-nicking Smr family endonuclease
MEDDDDDISLFKESQKNINRLKPTGKIKPEKKQTRYKPKKHSAPAEDEAQAFTLERDISIGEVKGDDYIDYHQAGIQAKTLKLLRQGKVPIDDELDLHGFTVEQAQAKLEKFLDHALHNHYRYLRIVHGKGYTSGLEFPPLKNLVNRYVKQCDQVIAFNSAPQNQGGHGAVLVLLSKS